MQEWILGGVLMVAAPFAFKWLRSFLQALPHKAIMALKDRWKKKLEANEVDADLDDLCRSIGKAIAQYAERKLPDEGLGAQRMELLLNTMYRIPFGLGFLCRKYPKELQELLEIAVKAMDEEAKAQLPPPV